MWWDYIKLKAAQQRKSTTNLKGNFEGEIIFANQESEKQLISKIYKKNSYNSVT